MSNLERRLALTSLILRWSEAMRGNSADGERAAFSVTGSSTPAQAAALAAELASLMDMIETEDKSLEGLAGLVLEKFSAHWQLTIDFLEDHHGILAGVSGRARISCRRPGGAMPSSMPKRAARSVAAEGPGDHRRRQRFDPGDRRADAHRHGAAARRHRAAGARSRARRRKLGHDQADTADATAHPENPQFGMKTLLDGLGLSRADVTVLKGAEQAPDQAARSVFVSEAMRPAGTTARWQAFAAAARSGKVRPPPV